MNNSTLLHNISPDQIITLFEGLQKQLSEIQKSIGIKNQSPEEPFIKMEEVCKIFGVSDVTIHSYKKKGIIPFYRISNKIFFKRSEVIASLSKINGGA